MCLYSPEFLGNCTWIADTSPPAFPAACYVQKENMDKEEVSREWKTKLCEKTFTKGHIWCNVFLGKVTQCKLRNTLVIVKSMEMENRELLNTHNGIPAPLPNE